MFKVNNRNTCKRCKICSKLTIKTTERRQLLTHCSSVSLVNFEQVNAGWVLSLFYMTSASQSETYSEPCQISEMERFVAFSH